MGVVELGYAGAKKEPMTNAKDAAEKATGDRGDYHALNAMLNLYDMDGNIQFDKDRMAARQYFLQHVNQNTVFFHNLEEKLEYLVTNKYYEGDVLAQYDMTFIKALYDRAYKFKFRFQTFLGAFKYLRRQTLSGTLRRPGCHGRARAGPR